MGNEMGNNNATSALYEEDNTSEAEKKAFNEELTGESKEEENQKTPADKGSDGETKDDGLASNDRSGSGNEMSKGNHALGDGKKGENQMEEAAVALDNAIIEPGKDILEEDSHEDDVKGPNQMIPLADTENVEEKAREFTTVESTIMVENDSSKSDTHGDVIIIQNQMPPEVEAEDVLSNDRSPASNNVLNLLENATGEGIASEDDENGDQQNHLSTEGEVVQEQAAGIDSNDRTSELQERTQKEAPDNDEPCENATGPISEDLNVVGNATNLSSDDQSNVKDSFSDSGHQITETMQVEKSSNVGLADEGENYKGLSNFSLKSTEEYDKQIDLCKNQQVTYDHHLDEESSINQEEDNTVVLTTSHDVELQESSKIDSFHDELDEVLEEPSLQGSETLQKSDLPDSDTLSLMDDGIGSDKEKEIQENMLCGVSTGCPDEDELGSSEKCESEITDSFSSINEKGNQSLLAEVNHITDHSVDSPSESHVVDTQLKFDGEKMSKELQEERKMDISGSEMENSQDFEADIINGRSYGEGNMVLPCSVYEIGETDQVEEPKVSENGHQSDVCIGKGNTTSDETSTAPVQQGFMVPEAEGGGLIPGSTVVNCRLEQEESCAEKVLEEIEKKPEASHAMLKGSDGEHMSEHSNSNILTSGQKESHTRHNSSFMSHISNHQEYSISQFKSFTSNSLKASDHQEGNLDSSNLTIPALDIVDNEAFKKEKTDYSQRAEAASVKDAEITSEANLCNVPLVNNPVFANGGYEVIENSTRYSTESNPENQNISCLMQKSPSFNLNLRIETTKDESDRNPLLHQCNKTATEGLSNQSGLNLNMPCAEYEQQHILQHEEMPAEEKIVTMERSYSEKLHAPFLGLLREEEEAHILVMPKKQEKEDETMKEVKEMEFALPNKGKEKRKPRLSFFSSCMCCMTLTN